MSDDTLRLALAVAQSGNKKIGDCAVTYAAQASCPDDCAFRNAGCYAESGYVALSATNRLNAVADLFLVDALEVAEAEAEAIDELEIIPGRPMRLHTVGDCATDDAARVVAAAAERYMDAGGGPVFTYTHAWRVVQRASWGRVSVFASCETPQDVVEADRLHYAAAIVVRSFLGDTAYPLTGTDARPLRATETFDGRKIVPCPAQTRGRSCSTCGLCFRSEQRRNSGVVIGFELHGDGLAMRRGAATLAGQKVPRPTRAFIEAYLFEHGTPPSIEQIVEACDVIESSARQMLTRMGLR